MLRIFQRSKILFNLTLRPMANFHRSRGNLNVFQLRINYLSFSTEQREMTPLVRLNRDLRVLREQNKPMQAFGLFEKYKASVKPDIHTYTILIDSLSKSNQVVQIKQLMKDASERGIILGQIALSPYLKVLGHYGRLEELEECIENLKAEHVKSGSQEPPLDPVAYCLIIGSYGKNGFFTEMKKYAEEFKLYYHELDQMTYTIIIDCFGKHGKFEEVQEYLNEMKSKSMKPDLVLYNSIVSSLGKYGKHEEMNTYLGELKGNEIDMDDISYNSLIAIFARSGEIQRSIDLIEEMKQKQIVLSAPTFNPLLDHYAKSGDIAEFNKWLANMKAHNIPPDEPTYGSIISLLAKRELFEDIEKIIQTMKFKKIAITSFTFNLVINIFGRAGYLFEMRKYIEEMKRQKIPFDQITYNVIIDSIGRYGRVTDVLDYISQLEADKINFSTLTYNGIINRMVYFKAWDQFWKYFSDAKRKGMVDAITFTSVIQAYGFMNDIDRLNSVPNELKSLGISENVFTFQSFVRAFMRLERIADAKRIILDMVSKNFTLTNKIAGSFIYGLKEDQIPTQVHQEFKALKYAYHDANDQQEGVPLLEHESQRFLNFLKHF